MRLRERFVRFDRRTLTRVLLYGVFFAPLAKFTPWYVFICVALAVIVLHGVVESRLRRRRYRAILEGIQQTQSNLLPDIAQIKGTKGIITRECCWRSRLRGRLP